MAKNGGKSEKERLYLGVDVGGTKVQASLVEESGARIARDRCRTPRDGGPEDVLSAIETAVAAAVKKAGFELADVAAMAVAVPGVVDPDSARVVVTPNMCLSGVDIGRLLGDRFDMPVAVGNDCNLGALGEKWLGSASWAESVVAILVGTGIGSGIVLGGKLWRGSREAAAEIGHIVMQIGGPKCGCGNYGCFEALAGRAAIERDIRAAVDSGRGSLVTQLTDGDLSVIRSGILRRALAAEDEVVTEIMHRAAEVIGHACLTVRHLIDPEVIVLGGGVMEACHAFMMPTIEEIVAADQLPGAREGGRVLLSALGDDAVVLGAVALARRLVGRSPFKRRFQKKQEYPKIDETSFGQITVKGKTHSRDVYILVNGKVKKRNKSLAKDTYGNSHVVGPKELDLVCRGGPEVIFIGSGQSGAAKLDEQGRKYLSQRSIGVEVLPTPQAVEAYNKSDRRKAALIHVTC